jgi:hypothetical protein
VYILELQHKLVELARERVKAGEITERGLARMCHVSQPHMHNVLKNVRAFSNGSSDRLMRVLGVHIADLVWSASGKADAEVRPVPIVRSRIGPGTVTDLAVFRGNLPMPGWLLRGAVDPIIARLAPDLILPSALAPNDLVLLDQNPALRAAPSERSLWIVAVGAGLRARHVCVRGGQLYAGNEVTWADPQQWPPVPLQGQNILDIVRARIVWIGREVETEPAGSADPAHQSHRSDRRT